jgi:hypothetical protein
VQIATVLKDASLKKHMRRYVLALVFLSIALYILFPTADEAFVYPTVGSAISELFGTSLAKGIFISAVLYRGTGIIFLAIALFIGGKPIYRRLKTKLKKK